MGTGNKWTNVLFACIDHVIISHPPVIIHLRLWPLLHFGFQLKFTAHKLFCAWVSFDDRVAHTMVDHWRLTKLTHTHILTYDAPHNQSIAAAGVDSIEWIWNGGQSILPDVIVFVRFNVTCRERERVNQFWLRRLSETGALDHIRYHFGILHDTRSSLCCRWIQPNCMRC